jgi:hypothetical protein
VRWLLPLALTLAYLNYVWWGYGVVEPPTPASYAVGPCFIAAAILWARK